MYVKSLVAIAVTLGVTSPGRAQSLPTDLEDLRGRWNLVLPTIRVLGSPGFPCRLSPEPYETGVYFSREAGRSDFDMYYDVNGGLVYMGEGTIRNGVFNMMMNRVDGMIRVHFTGRMQHGLNDVGEHISSITGELTCGDAEGNFFITRWNPNVKPDGMPYGTAQYYRFRDADFRKRHPQQNPPEYYLRYGARYVNVLSVGIRDRLSPRGQRFVADVAVRLQRTMDSQIMADPAGFDALEISGSLEDFAFSSHVDAYCGAGWEELPEADRDLIVSSIDIWDKWLRYHALRTSVRILRRCGHLQDGVPDWEWLPELEESQRRVAEVLRSTRDLIQGSRFRR